MPIQQRSFIHSTRIPYWLHNDGWRKKKATNHNHFDPLCYRIWFIFFFFQNTSEMTQLPYRTSFTTLSRKLQKLKKKKVFSKHLKNQVKFNPVFFFDHFLWSFKKKKKSNLYTEVTVIHSWWKADEKLSCVGKKLQTYINLNFFFFQCFRTQTVWFHFNEFDSFTVAITRYCPSAELQQLLLFTSILLKRKTNTLAYTWVKKNSLQES